MRLLFRGLSVILVTEFRTRKNFAKSDKNDNFKSVTKMIFKKYIQSVVPKSKNVLPGPVVLNTPVLTPALNLIHVCDTYSPKKKPQKTQ